MAAPQNPHMRAGFRLLTAAVASAIALSAATGCIRRTISITSDPDGALVYLNHREIGRTPVEVEFLYYGDYDVRLIKDGYEPLIVRGDASAPAWDTPPLDLFAEAVPDSRNSIHWHYQLEPVIEDPAALTERARAIRQQLAADIVESGVEVATESGEARNEKSGNSHDDSEREGEPDSPDPDR